jgi:hypothetical protein
MSTAFPEAEPPREFGSFVAWHTADGLTWLVGVQTFGPDGSVPHIIEIDRAEVERHLAGLTRRLEETR